MSQQPTTDQAPAVQAPDKQAPDKQIPVRPAATGYTPERVTASPAFSRVDVVATGTVWQARTMVQQQRPELDDRDAALIGHLHTRHGIPVDVLYTGLDDPNTGIEGWRALHDADPHSTALTGNPDTGPSAPPADHHHQTGDGSPMVSPETLPVYQWVSEITKDRDRARLEFWRDHYSELELTADELLGEVAAQRLAHQDSAEFAWQLYCAATGQSIETFAGVTSGGPVREVAAAGEAGQRALIEVERLRARLDDAHDEAETLRRDRDLLGAEIGRLADWITQNMPDAPGAGGTSESAVDVAIRVLDSARTAIRFVWPVLRRQWAQVLASGLVDQRLRAAVGAAAARPIGTLRGADMVRETTPARQVLADYAEHVQAVTGDAATNTATNTATDEEETAQ